MDRSSPVTLPFLGLGTEEALRAMADALPDGVFTTDPKGIITYWNAAAERITGRTRAEALGQDCSLLAGDAVHGCSCGAGPLRCGLASSGRASKCCTCRAKDGRMLLIVKNAVPLYAASGAVVGALESFTDVTELPGAQVQLQARREPAEDFHGLVGRDAAMRELYETIELVAGSDATVLVVGESGTGKERIAEAIHALSRRGGPLVRVACSSAEELVADGGPLAPGPGAFAKASGGTLLLDEVGDAPADVQVRLLRAIERHQLDRAADGGPARADVRLVCTTHHDLKALVRAGSFRGDLYFRVAAFPLRVPPLREHVSDLPLLAEHLLSRGRAREPLATAVLSALAAYPWPGNVRELRNALEFAALRAGSRAIRVEDLPPEIREAAASAAAQAQPARPGGRPGRDAVAAALAETRWNRSEAARRLGISRVTLWKLIKELGLQRPAT